MPKFEFSTRQVAQITGRDVAWVHNNRKAGYFRSCDSSGRQGVKCAFDVINALRAYITSELERLEVSAMARQHVSALCAELLDAQLAPRPYVVIRGNEVWRVSAAEAGKLVGSKEHLVFDLRSARSTFAMDLDIGLRSTLARMAEAN